MRVLIQEDIGGQEAVISSETAHRLTEEKVFIVIRMEAVL
jgi:hypothetical protein